MALCVRTGKEGRFLPGPSHWRYVKQVLPLALVLFSFGCSADTEGKQGQRTAAPVTVGSVVEKDVPVQLRAIGNVDPYSSVSMKSMVSGQLVKTAFEEGQAVKKGDLLFVIDPRPYEADLKQAEAMLEKDLALVKQAEANRARNESQVKHAEALLTKDLVQAKMAKVQAERYAALAEKGNVSKEQYDQVRTNSDALEASVLADRAAMEEARASLRASDATVEHARAAVRASSAGVENAKLQLAYCSIHSPLDGRTGDLHVKKGNIIKANDVVLVEINQVHPVYVAFSVPEQHLGDIRRHMARGALKVKASTPGEGNQAEEGVLTFVDNSVDRTTGTIRLKGTFPNAQDRLWPGQFVDVALILATESGAIVVPSEAVQIGQEGPYVFVVTPDLTAEYRKVTVGRSLSGETVVAQGVRPGERVVTDGYLRLSPGAKVEIKADLAKTKHNK
ncbi:MAG: efflux RND transporter periplasmic adaptor subunit [Pseudomonadota bacterium]